MNPRSELLRAMTRRHFLMRSGLGVGALALNALIGRSAAATPAETATNPLSPKPPHFPPRAKRIIYLNMVGAPSQLDLFEHKPRLNQLDGQKIPEEFMKGQRFAFIKGTPDLYGSPHTFNRYGQSGAELSNLLPYLTEVADEIAIVKSLFTEQFNHAPAQMFIGTGQKMFGHPSFGAWLTYGLGSENNDLPGFVVLLSGDRDPDAGKSLWGSGFLPTSYQGVEFRAEGNPVLFVSSPDGVSDPVRRNTLDLIAQLNQHAFERVGDPEILTRINSYEMAYRMQTSVPELMDITREPACIHELYGTEPGKVSFANNCLLTRRLIERGVRFVQLCHRGWDHHGGNEQEDIPHGLPRLCQQTDRATAALIKDLKQRGLLDTTLLVWGGEFGRTPMNEKRSAQFPGRDHHTEAFTMWLAGGGIKAGITIGETDELGYNIVEDKTSVHDLHATILHLMGLDHSRLTHRFQGRDFRLTDVSGTVVKKLLA